MSRREEHWGSVLCRLCIKIRFPRLAAVRLVIRASKPKRGVALWG